MPQNILIAADEPDVLEVIQFRPSARRSTAKPNYDKCDE